MSQEWQGPSTGVVILQQLSQEVFQGVEEAVHSVRIREDAF